MSARSGQVSYPRQYSQIEVGKFLWTLNFLLRTALNRALPAVFSAHSFMMVQQGGTPYSSILQVLPIRRDGSKPCSYMPLFPRGDVLRL